MYKIVTVELQECSRKTITKNRCKPSKTAYSGHFGTPGWVRTSGLSLRRRPLYPTELRGLIQKIFNFAGLQDSNDSIFRRRVLYPTELLRPIKISFVTARYRDYNSNFGYRRCIPQKSVALRKIICIERLYAVSLS